METNKIKNAVNSAFKYANEILGLHQKMPNLRLEEINVKGKAILITLGYDTPEFIERDIKIPLTSATTEVIKERKRDYKIFQIDADSGDLLGVKSRIIKL